MIKLKSYSKINLTLSVGKKRKDSFHDLDSIVCTTDLCDVICLEKSDDIYMKCSNPDVPAGSDNIIYKAAVAFFESAGISSGAYITLEKNIPMQAGLGGGSGNAAAVLIGLNRLYDAKLSLDTLVAIGWKIGSDVPLFLHGGLVRMTGRGDVVTELCETDFSLKLIIIKPSIGISTKWAYDQLDKRLICGDFSISDKMQLAIEEGDFDTAVNLISNDFDILCDNFPQIIDAKLALVNCGAEKVCLSGSGSAVFGVFDETAFAYNHLKDKYNCMVCKSIKRSAMYE